MRKVADRTVVSRVGRLLCLFVDDIVSFYLKLRAGEEHMLFRRR